VIAPDGAEVRAVASTAVAIEPIVSKKRMMNRRISNQKKKGVMCVCCFKRVEMLFDLGKTSSYKGKRYSISENFMPWPRT
jgi:hypothetical protein